METEHLEEFVELADCLSFSRCAETMNTTQSTLSKHIRSLETELGEDLFIRESRSVSLSPFGTIFLPYAKTITDAASRAHDAARAFQSKTENTFWLPVVRNPQYYGIDQILVEFHDRYPECTINIVETDANEAYRLYSEGKVNLFATYKLEEETLPFDFIEMGESEIVAALPDNYLLTGDDETADRIFIEKLLSEPLMLPSRSSKASQLILKKLNENSSDKDINIVFEGGSFGSLDLVKAGMGISLQPKELVQNYTKSEIRYCSIEPPIKLIYGLGLAKKSKLNSGEVIFTNFILNTRVQP